ncbi:MAG: bifunctional diaminohydroxyphosphoribosylaminopyrimidine deaminase/5-amino-6-(5-phosphoribosylamino)uracil reductase RibD [Candidatus Acidiferrales bacterium]
MTRKLTSTHSSTDKKSRDAFWMARALELARRGTGLASPNPMVGAVVVRKGRVIGEGFHIYEGRKHAEIVALEKAGSAARGATLYVNLEPCSHTGRTGPCSRAIIAAGIKRVVASIRDPNRLVAGGGFRELRDAGVEIDVGIADGEARVLNESFAKWIRTRLPFVTLKSAMTIDGKIAAARGRATSITSSVSRAAVQQLRHASDTILTGIGTVLTDDPLLTDRTGLPRRRPLLRVVMDSRLRLPLRSALVKSAHEDVLIFTLASAKSAKARALGRAGVEVVQLPRRGKRPDLRAALVELGKRQVLGVLLEAGSELNGAALSAGIVDKTALFIAPKIFGSSDVMWARWPSGSRAAMQPLRDMKCRQSGTDILLEGYFSNVYGHYRTRRKN